MQAWQGEALHAMRVMQSKPSNAPRHAPHHHTTHHTPHHFTSRASVWQSAASMTRGSKSCNADHAKPAELCQAKRVKQRKCSRCNRHSKQVLHAAGLQSTTLNLVSTRVRGVTLYGLYDAAFAVRFVAFWTGLLVCNLQHALSKVCKRSRPNGMMR